MLAEILTASGERVLHNRAGANLIAGLTATAVKNADWRGRPRATIGLFETDEAAVPQALAELRPRLDHECLEVPVVRAQGALGEVGRHGLHTGERAAQLAQANGQRMMLGLARADLGIVALRCGDVAAARESVAAACVIALTLEAPALKSVAAMAFARLLHHTDHVEAARRVLALTASEPALVAADRAKLERLRFEWGAPAPSAQPGLTLDALLHRAAVEAPGGHAALIEFLGG